MTPSTKYSWLASPLDVGEGQHDDRKAPLVRLFRRWRRKRLRHAVRPGPDRKDLDWTGDVPQRFLAEIDEAFLHPVAHLLVSRAGQTDPARPGDALDPHGDIDAVAHQIAVALFDDIAQMHADAELDALVRRNARVALDDAGLYFDRATRRVDYAAKLD